MDAFQDSAKSSYVVEELSKLDIKITQQQIAQVEAMVVHFEIRGSNPLTLNSQYLGIHPIAFTDSDRDALFHIFKVSEADVQAAVKKIPTIKKDWKVAGDPFNVLCEWVMHLAFIYIRNDRIRHQFLMNIAKYLHYRFFTSLVNRYYTHRAKENVMMAAINSLTRKFDIVVYGTWKRTIEARCEDLISPQSIHYPVLVTGSPDKAFVYFLTDTQTRIRDKVGNVTDVYYDFYREGNSIETKSAFGTDADGEKVLVQKTSVFDSTITNVCSEVMNLISFIDNSDIKFVTTRVNSVSPELLKAVLVAMSETAARQQSDKQLEKTQKVNGMEIDVGIQGLVRKLIQTSYAYCMNNGVNMSRKAEIYKALKNAYSSSRIADPDIQRVRASVAYFVDGLGKTRRDATLSALRICTILYIIVRSFRYLPS